MANKKVLLAILDGWGIGDGSEADVIYNANTPNMDELQKKYPGSRLSTSGESVGLPTGQMGNSEVGHLNLGAGRVIYQDIVRINKAIDDGSFFENETLKKAYSYAKENDKKVHLLGLVSDGGVHSSMKHLYALCDMAKREDFSDLYIHALTDGRDTDPRSGKGFMTDLSSHLDNSNGRIASVCGRYYTMDRDKRWERIKMGYDLLLHAEGKKTDGPEIDDILKAMQESYDDGVTDEFIKPIVVVDSDGQPMTKVEEGDVVICFNFRTDRLRQITVALTQKDLPEHDMHTIDLYYVTMTQYDDSFENIKIVFEKNWVKLPIGEYLAQKGKKQLRIAETEKYAHVTFFFSGGREEKFDGEDRVLINSPKVATYDLQPEMSAYKVKDALVDEMKKEKYDFICLNFANGDMVGHTGDYEAITKAVETVDECVGELYKTARETGYTMLIIADHGNADFARNRDGSPNTAHSTNPVPCILVDDDYDKIEDGILADVAPTVLTLMGLDIPDIMTGKSLVKND